MQIAYQDEVRFLRAKLAGSWTIDQVCAQPELILAECLARKRDLLLLDLTGLEFREPSTLDRYKLGASMTAFPGKLRRVAAVAVPEFIDPEKLGERVARNRGVNLRVFSDPDQALRWLLEEPAPE